MSIILEMTMWGGVDLILAFLVVLFILHQRGQALTLIRFRGLRKGRLSSPLTDTPRWLSTQPLPNPDAIPRVLSQRMGPFPMTPYGGDWNFFCYIYVAPGQPVRLRGRPSSCRHSNITIYAPEHLRGEAQFLPPSVDVGALSLGAHGDYELVISHEVVGGNRLDVQGGGRHWILAMRHYVFNDKTDIYYPEMYWGERCVLPARVEKVKSVLPREGGYRS